MSERVLRTEEILNGKMLFGHSSFSRSSLFYADFQISVLHLQLYTVIDICQRVNLKQN